MDCIKSGIIGQIVGDALGLAVQFEPREYRDRDPVTDMTDQSVLNLARVYVLSYNLFLLDKM